MYPLIMLVVMLPPVNTVNTDRINDFNMAYAVERSIYTFGCVDVLTESDQRILSGLGADSYNERRLATQLAYEHKSMRLTIWGTFRELNDIQTEVSCQNIITYLWKCMSCNGSGKCPVCAGERTLVNPVTGFYETCEACKAIVYGREDEDDYYHSTGLCQTCSGHGCIYRP